jgi:transketolase
MKVYSDMRDAFFEELYSIAEKDKDVMLLVGDQNAMSFKKFYEKIPNQIINAGISEQNLIGVSAGLSLSGKKVFVHAISNFLTLRCYEQINFDLGLMNLPVTLVGVGSGFSYGDEGATHHSTQDIALMKTIPGMNIYNASDTVSLARFPHLVYGNPGLNYIRFDKESFNPIYDKIDHNFNLGLAKIKEGDDALIISTGNMTHNALEITKQLGCKKINIGVIDLYRIKPLNKKLLLNYLTQSKNVITLEENLKYGGIGSTISDLICDEGLKIGFKRFGLEDKFSLDYGSRDYITKQAELDTNKVSEKIFKFLKTGRFKK